MENRDKDVVSVSKVQDPPVLMRQMDENGELTPLLTEGSTVRRQDMKPWYRVRQCVCQQGRTADKDDQS